MTKKDYIKIAECIKNYAHDNKKLITAITNMLEADNSKFDSFLFKKACSLDNSKIEKEQFYICDHSNICNNMSCLDGKEPLSNNKEWFNPKLLKKNKCPFLKVEVKLIPYSGVVYGDKC